MRLPSGAILLDTPGMRELQLWAAEESLEDTFADIADLAARCRFSHCAHDREPGCAILAALADGTLQAERFESHRKLQRELRAPQWAKTRGCSRRSGSAFGGCSA